MQYDIEEILSLKFGDPVNFPSWVQPFVRAVEVLEKLAENGGRGSARNGAIDEVESQLLAVSLEPMVGNAHADRDTRERQSTFKITGDTAVSLACRSLHGEGRLAESRRVGLKDVTLDPFHPSRILRLIKSYDREVKHIGTYNWMRKAMTLIPFAERPAHQDRLHSLRTLSEAAKAKLLRGDPFNILPLSIIVNIFQQSLSEDRHIALRSSWVNRKWNRTIANDCPQLWGTLTLPRHEIKNWLFFKEKAETWIERSHGKIHTIDIQGMTITAVTKMPKAFIPCMSTANHLRLKMVDNKTLWRFREKFHGSFHELKDLYIHGGDLGDGKSRDTYLYNVLHYLLLDSVQSLKTMENRNVDVREHDVPTWKAVTHTIKDNTRHRHVSDSFMRN